MKYYIKTYGCQMNESDSERIASFLENQGYKKTEKLERADLIVVVACSVRQTAIDRIFGLKNKFKKLQAKKFLTGCVLKSDKRKFEEFFDEALSINEFFKYHKFSDRTNYGKNYLEVKPKHLCKNSAFVPIMTGCDNFCSYCVVPYTRGRESSRSVTEIVKEFKELVKQGYKEIILLGQNVNSFKPSFVDLLKVLDKIPGNFKIKFLTSHPKPSTRAKLGAGPVPHRNKVSGAGDFSWDELIDTIANCKKVEKEIHLPLQSGDDEILRKMNRGYTVKQYKNLIKKIRKKIPQVKISTDVIVGFPGETEEQFQNTVKVFKEIRFDKAYINKYSPRFGTAAYGFKDNISLAEKKRRWRILNDIANRPKKPKLIVIVGPTASGKSGLAVKLVKKIKGEIISADSRQVYKGMDIGTGKITKKEMRGICHYCLDIASPKTQFTVVQYKKKALEAINKIYKKSKIPILCGGTGFYIQAVVDGLIIPKVKPDWKLRSELEKKGTGELFEELKKLDPQRAKSIDSHNRRRLIRAIEIVLKTGKPVPSFQIQPQFSTLFIGIKKPPQELKELIKKRLLKRLKQGMIEEVEMLKKSGLSWKRLDNFGLEYRYIAKHLKGELNKEEMIEKLKKEIEHYAKRQMTWFSAHGGPASGGKPKSIHWVLNYRQAEKLVRKFLEK